MLNNVGTVEQTSADLPTVFDCWKTRVKGRTCALLVFPNYHWRILNRRRKKVHKLITEKLNVNNVHVKSAYRAGANSIRTSNQPRPIIAKLSSLNKKISRFKASKELKGINIYLSEDVTKASLELRKQKLGALKEKRTKGS